MVHPGQHDAMYAGLFHRWRIYKSREAVFSHKWPSQRVTKHDKSHPTLWFHRNCKEPSGKRDCLVTCFSPLQMSLTSLWTQARMSSSSESHFSDPRKSCSDAGTSGLGCKNRGCLTTSSVSLSTRTRASSPQTFGVFPGCSTHMRKVTQCLSSSTSALSRSCWGT